MMGLFIHSIMLFRRLTVLRNHSFAVSAFVMVSWVVNVFEAMMNRVVSGFSLRVTCNQMRISMQSCEKSGIGNFEKKISFQNKLKDSIKVHIAETSRIFWYENKIRANWDILLQGDPLISYQIRNPLFGSARNQNSSNFCRLQK